jgi:hypothetical protein
LFLAERAEAASFGFLFDLEMGVMEDGVFQYFEDNEKTEELSLGNNFYFDITIRFYVGRLFLELNRADAFYFNGYSAPYMMTLGAALGWVPYNRLTLKIGYMLREFESISIPEHHQYKDNIVRVELTFIAGETFGAVK